MPIGSAVRRRSVLFVNIGLRRKVIQCFLQLSLKLHIFRTPVPVNNSFQGLEFLLFHHPALAMRVTILPACQHLLLLRQYRLIEATHEILVILPACRAYVPAWLELSLVAVPVGFQLAKSVNLVVQLFLRPAHFLALAALFCFADRNNSTDAF